MLQVRIVAVFCCWYFKAFDWDDKYELGSQVFSGSWHNGEY